MHIRQPNPPEAEGLLAAVTEFLSKKNIPFYQAKSKSDVQFHGGFASTRRRDKEIDLVLTLDPIIMNARFSDILELARALRNDGLKSTTIGLELYSAVIAFNEMHKISSRLFGSEVDFVNGVRLRRKNLEFHIRMPSAINVSLLRGEPEPLGAAIYLHLVDDFFPP